ncbi:MAG: c-type cytochrome [Anaerolineae bacterium]
MTRRLVSRCITLIAVWVVLAGLSGCGPTGMRFERNRPDDNRYASNGERIYWSATSERGTSVVPKLDGGMMMRRSLACVDCHGSDGRGGGVRFGMQIVEVPDIRYEVLTGESMEHDEEEEEHPPFTDETIRRAITEGIDPAGEPLDWPMPRWRIAEEDLDDLIKYLKQLDGRRTRRQTFEEEAGT